MVPVSSARRGTLIAIDLGTKKSGFAVTDALRISRETLPAFHGVGEALLAHVERLVAERDVEAFVVGVPANMDSSEGERAKACRAFAAELARRFPRIAVRTQDERLSTKEAEQRLRDSGVRGDKARALRDSTAALVILGDWLREHEGG